MSIKRRRHDAILEIVNGRRIQNQEQLKEALMARGIEVAQATLSRDLRELQLRKAGDSDGVTSYAPSPDAGESVPALDRLAPALYLHSEGVGNLLVVRTLTGGAQPLAAALDWEEWPEVLGTIAGDDSVLIVLRDPAQLAAVRERLEKVADKADDDM